MKFEIQANLSNIKFKFQLTQT